MSLNKEQMREYMRKRRAEKTDTVICHVESSGEVKADPVDPKIWAYAVIRAERANWYALKMPEFIRKDDLVFQDVAWQYERELRFTKQFTH